MKLKYLPTFFRIHGNDDRLDSKQKKNKTLFISLMVVVVIIKKEHIITIEAQARLKIFEFAI